MDALAIPSAMCQLSTFLCFPTQTALSHAKMMRRKSENCSAHSRARGQIELPSEGSKKEAEKGNWNGATPCNLSNHPRSINQHLDVFFSRIIANSVHARWNRWWAKCVWGRPLLCALFVISTRHLLVPFVLLHFPSHQGPEAHQKKTTYRRRDAYERDVERMSKIYTIFPLHERKNGARKKRKIMKKEGKKSPRWKNCNNITLDQASTYPHPKWWFGIFFRRGWCEDNRFSCWVFCFLERVISGWIAEAAECDGWWMRGKKSEYWLRAFANGMPRSAFW